MARKRDANHAQVSRHIQAEFGKRLQAARKSAGHIQVSFARQMGVTRATISNIERGNQRIFLDQVFQAAHLLGTSIASLLPSSSEIYPEPAIRTAADNPLPVNAAVEASRVIQDLTRQPKKLLKSAGRFAIRRPLHKR